MSAGVESVRGRGRPPHKSATADIIRSVSNPLLNPREGAILASSALAPLRN